MRGIGEPQRQIGEDGFGVSGAPVALPMVIGPIEIGNRHSQQTSAIGLTKRPVQVWAEAEPVEQPPAISTRPPGKRSRAASWLDLRGPVPAPR